MAFTHFVNATPLTLQVRVLGSENVQAVVAPCDEVTVKTPLGAKFVISDDRDRITVQLNAIAGSERSDFVITDDHIYIGRYGVRARATLVNTLPYSVQVLALREDGSAIRALDIRANEQLRMNFNGDPVRALRVVAAELATKKLDLLLLDSQKPYSIVDRYGIVRQMLARDPALLNGRYDVLKPEMQAPDPADTKYIRYGHQTLEAREINGWTRPVRKVTIFGVDLVFDASDRSKFLCQYQEAEDIAELWIHADTVVVKNALRFPGTDVHIRCRDLQFEGANSYIDVTPVFKAFRDPLSIDGEDGSKGGNFTVYTSSFHTDQKDAKHFRSHGSRGQAPDQGGVEESKSLRTLEAITEAKWNEFFSAETRKLPHEELFGDKFGYHTTMPFPSFQEKTGEFPNIVYIEIRNSYHRDNLQINQSDLELHRSWGTKEEPGRGGKGKQPGKPGTGGAGGNFECLLKTLMPFVDLSGGESGAALGATAGGAGGTPSSCSWLFYECRPDRANHIIQYRGETKSAIAGADSPPGPLASALAGQPGRFRVHSSRRGSWVSAVNLSVALQFARDACASSYFDYADALLSHYVEATPATNLPAEVGQLLREGHELLRLAATNVDFLGKPPGWVPTLSLQSAAGLYDSVLPQAMKELYASYYIERVARSKQDKRKALQSLSKLLKTSSQTAQTELVDIRKQLPGAMQELSQLLSELGEVQKQTGERHKVLREQADKDAASQEIKEGIAAAFKITGAVIKAIPLPEPYQTAASGLGSIFDIAGEFVDAGASGGAFENLKTHVTAFTGLKDNLGAYMDSVSNATLDVSDLEREAAAATDVKQSLEDKYGGQAKALDEAKAKSRAVYEAKHRALLYGRAKDNKERDRIVKEAGLMASKYEDGIKKLEDATNEKAKDYRHAQSKVASIEGEIASKKADFAKGELERNKKAEANKKTVATRMQQLQNVATSVVTIDATIKKLAVSSAKMSTNFDAAVAKLAGQDQEFANLCRRIKFLNEKKEKVAARISQIAGDLAERTNKISKNMLVTNEIAGQIATSNESFDANALAYIQSVGQDAHLTLTKFLYYTVKAFEYYMVRPWGQSYLSAQNFFDDLRRVLEPSTFKMDSLVDPQGNKQAELEKILKDPDPRNAGMLTPAEFDLLKTIYEKPLLDIGRQLASELMEGNSKSLKETQSTITLTSDWLADLNARILSRDKRDQVLFNLTDLRQIGRSVDKQRISNIRVITAQAMKRGPRFPDTVQFVFEHLGKSVVRSLGKLFAFEPQDSSGKTSGDAESAGVSFVTSGGKRTGQPIGWVESTVDSKLIGMLNSSSLWQPDAAAQENLLSKLMKNAATVSLSQFRPGAFSDFLFTVNINPPECKLEFTEIVLEVSYEGGNASRDEILICVSNNLGLEIPITTSIKDMSGRGGATGRYVGIFNSRKMTAAGQSAVRVQVPRTYGSYALKSSWDINGERQVVRNDYYDVSKDVYIVAIYEASKEALWR